MQGGLNDTDTGAVRAKVDVLKGATAHLVIVGPAAAPSKDAAKGRAMDAALRASAADVGARYVSLLDVNLPYQADGLHPTDRGQALIAAAVARDLTR